MRKKSSASGIRNCCKYVIKNGSRPGSSSCSWDIIRSRSVMSALLFALYRVKLSRGSPWLFPTCKPEKIDRLFSIDVCLLNRFLATLCKFVVDIARWFLNSNNL